MPFVAAKSSVRPLSKPASHVYVYTLSEFADEVDKQCRRQANEADDSACEPDSSSFEFS